MNRLSSSSRICSPHNGSLHIHDAQRQTHKPSRWQGKC